MVTVNVILLVFAFVFLCLKALKIPEHPRIDWGWLGLSIWMLVGVIGVLVK